MICRRDTAGTRCPALCGLYCAVEVASVEEAEASDGEGGLDVSVGVVMPVSSTWEGVEDAAFCVTDFGGFEAPAGLGWAGGGDWLARRQLEAVGPAAGGVVDPQDLQG